MPRKNQFILTALSCTFAWTAAALDRSDLLPEGEAFIRINEAQSFRNDFYELYGKQLQADSKVKDFTAAFSEKLKKKSANGDISLSTLQFWEILKGLNGEIALIYNADDSGKTFKAGKVYLTAAASALDWKQIQERTAWRQKQSLEEVTRKTESFQGLEMVHDIMIRVDESRHDLWLAHVNQTLLVSSEREWVERNVVRLKNEAITEPKGNKLSCRLPLNLMLRNTLNEKEGPQRVQTEQLWTGLGLLGLQQYLLEIEINNGELVLDGTLTGTGFKKGLFALLNTDPADFSNDRIVPDNATSFSYGRLDLPNFWKQLPETLAALPSKLSAPLAGLISFFEKQSGLNIEHDLLPHIGNRFTLHTEQISTNQPMLVSLELYDGPAVDAALAKLMVSPLGTAATPFIQSSDFRGHTVYLLKAKNPTAEPSSLCVSGDRLLYGSNAAILREAVLRLEGNTRTVPSEFQETARSYAPDRAFGYGAMNHRKTSGLLYIRASDSSFSAGFGFSSKSTSPSNGKERKLEENEISLNHLSGFLKNTVHFAEAVPGGIHHQLIFKQD